MSKRFEEIRRLVRKGALLICEHEYDELSADAILSRDVVERVPAARRRPRGSEFSNF